MADELDALRRLTERRQRAEREWVAQVRYEVIVELVRPTS
jgi:hypothetical protein